MEPVEEHAVDATVGVTAAVAVTGRRADGAAPGRFAPRDEVVESVTATFAGTGADLDVAALRELLASCGPGVLRVAAERARQVAEEGFTTESDSAYTTELARASQSYVAAALYAQATGSALTLPPDSWPFPPSEFKPSADPVRNLEKAAALLTAELDRIEYTSGR